MTPNRERILAVFAEYQDIQATADDFGVNFSTVNKILKQVNIPIPTPQRRRYQRKIHSPRKIR